MRPLSIIFIILGISLFTLVIPLTYFRQSPSEAMMILYMTVEDQQVVFNTMHPDGSHQRVISRSDYWDIEPQWSSDTRWIVFQSFVNDDNELYRISANGSERQPLTRNAHNDTSHTLSPDGEWIAFVSFIDGDTEIFRMRIDGTDLEQLTDDAVNDFAPTISADGESIFFIKSGEQTRLYRMQADGTNVEIVSDADLANVISFWSDDRAWLYFAQPDHTRFHIYRIPMDHPEPELVANLDDSAIPVISPDGKWLVYSTFRDGKSRLYRMRSDGSDLVLLSDTPASYGNLAWSPNGEWLLFSSRQGHYSELFRIQADGSDSQQLTTNNVDEREVIWSPLIDLPLNGGLLLFVGGLLILSPFAVVTIYRKYATTF